MRAIELAVSLGQAFACLRYWPLSFFGEVLTFEKFSCAGCVLCVLFLNHLKGVFHVCGTNKRNQL